MIVAIDKDKRRVHISSAKDGEKYYCPICNKEVLQRKGQIKAHHFAHFPNSNCIDKWHYEMSDWHFDWQNRFDEKYLEIVKTFQNKTHRADVLIEDEKVVIEFQHSDISIKEYEDRNYFYHKLGYKVIWLFDMREEYENKNICYLDEESNNEKFYYLYPKKIFSNFDYKNDDVSLFFQLKGEKEDNSIKIIKITWVSPKGIYRFCGKKYNLNQFLSFCKNEKVKVEYEKLSIPYFLLSNPGVPIIVRNRKTLEEFLISPNALENLDKYRAIYGKTSDSFGKYTKKSEIILDAFKPNWILLWKPKKKKN